MGDPPVAAPGSSVVRDQWELFLNARFGAGTWTFESSRAGQTLLVNHVYVLAPLVASLLLLVLLLSSIEIRRILVPLEALMARIDAVGAGTRARSRPGREDEIGALACTFGDMEQRIGRQLETLGTLAQIDRMILDRVDSQVVVSLVLARARAGGRDGGRGQPPQQGACRWHEALRLGPGTDQVRPGRFASAGAWCAPRNTRPTARRAAGASPSTWVRASCSMARARP